MAQVKGEIEQLEPQEDSSSLRGRTLTLKDENMTSKALVDDELEQQIANLYKSISEVKMQLADVKARLTKLEPARADVIMDHVSTCFLDRMVDFLLCNRPTDDGKQPRQSSPDGRSAKQIWLQETMLVDCASELRLKDVYDSVRLDATISDRLLKFLQIYDNKVSSADLRACCERLDQLLADLRLEPKRNAHSCANVSTDEIEAVTGDDTRIGQIGRRQRLGLLNVLKQTAPDRSPGLLFGA